MWLPASTPVLFFARLAGTPTTAFTRVPLARSSRRDFSEVNLSRSRRHHLSAAHARTPVLWILTCQNYYSCKSRTTLVDKDSIRRNDSGLSLDEQYLLTDIQPHRDSPKAVCPLTKICFTGNLSPLPLQRLRPPPSVHRLGL